jgi:hypothetical protein
MSIFTSITYWWYKTNLKPAAARNIPVSNVNIRDLKPEMIWARPEEILAKRKTLKHIEILPRPTAFDPMNEMIGELHIFFQKRNFDGTTPLVFKI